MKVTVELTKGNIKLIESWCYRHPTRFIFLRTVNVMGKLFVAIRKQSTRKAGKK